MDKKLLEFSVEIYGDLVPYNKTLSKARCRIFYKYSNRNGTYLTDLFADKLASTLPYTPIKGIYIEADSDYSDHGERTMGRIYGIVPETNNFSWEPHTDADGITRIYACCDVLLFTALYEEASDIVGKSLSMELYEKSITGNWKMVDGKNFYVFDDGCFLGLQILGDEVEPCFEGAAFFSLKETFNSLLKDIQEYDLKNKVNGGESKMHKLNFKVEDAKYEILWSLLNTNYSEESNWTVNYSIIELTDTNILVKNHETNEYALIPYTVLNDEYKLDVDGKEIYTMVLPTTKENLDSMNEKIEKFSEFEQKILESENTISTLKTERDNSVEQYNALKVDYDKMADEVESLKSYKLDKETKEKEAEVAKYSKRLDSEIIKTFTDNLSSYTLDELKKNLAYELVNSDDSILLGKTEKEALLPKDNEPVDELSAILNKYN